VTSSDAAKPKVDEKDPWTIQSVLRWATDDFRGRGLESPRLDAELLLAHALGVPRLRLIVDGLRPLTSDELSRFRALVVRRRQYEPVAYLLGEREFYGRPFRVDSRVLIPRPDTETLVAVALRRCQARNLFVETLELCTGSGCVAISLAKELPTARITATDLSKDALRVARANLLTLGAYNIELRHGDLFAAVTRGASFDLVVANPPYIPAGELPTLAPDIQNHEPRLALDGGTDGLVLVRRIVDEARAFLRPGGLLALEIGAGQADDVLRHFAEHGYRSLEVEKDYGGIGRVVSGLLFEAPKK
jgi:release factor glutamine methyltransferase